VQVTNPRLHITLTETLEWEKILKKQLDETHSQIHVESRGVKADEERELELLYRFKDSQHVKELHFAGKEEVSMQPLIKTETVDDGQGGAQHIITFPPGPLKIPVTFLVYMGTQMLALQTDVANLSGIAANRKQVWVTDVFGYSTS